MQKQFIALSLFASSGLLASEGGYPHLNPFAEDTSFYNEEVAQDDDMQNSYYSRKNQQTEPSQCEEECTCCQSYSSCCCTPCCCEPEPVIDCECYTPAFYNSDCMCGFSVSVSFLYWYARETNLNFGTHFAVIPETPGGTVANTNFRSAPIAYEYLDADWNTGFRVAVGYNQGCDGWDYYLNWTYFHNRESDSTSTLSFEPNLPGANQEGFLNPWINQSFTGQNVSTDPFFQKMTAKWALDFNSVDLELGRKYWLSPCFTLRPYIGLRGAWTRTRFRVQGTTFPTLVGSTTFVSRNSTNRFRNRNWGVGFLTGIQPAWYYCRTDCRRFSIFGNLDVSLLWGEFESKPRERYTEGSGTTNPPPLVIDINQSAKASFFKMAPILDLGIGLSWEEMWCCNRYRSTLDVGWEHHVWFQHGLYHRNTGNLNNGGGGPGARNFFTNTITTDTNLVYGGLVIRGTFEF